MAEPVVLAAQPRTVLGKRVRHLRREGQLPANVYGRGIESTAIQLNHREFLRTLRNSGIHSMFELSIDGEDKARYVIVRGVERYGGNGEPIHVDFLQVDPNEPIQAHVPIRLVGEAPAVRDLAGTLIQSLESVAVRCLPLDIPEAIEADVGPITGFEVILTIGDVTPPDGVEILTDPTVPVASVAPPRIRLEDEEEAGEEAEGEEAPAAEEEASAE